MNIPHGHVTVAKEIMHHGNLTVSFAGLRRTSFISFGNFIIQFWLDSSSSVMYSNVTRCFLHKYLFYIIALTGVCILMMHSSHFYVGSFGKGNGVRVTRKVQEGSSLQTECSYHLSHFSPTSRLSHTFHLWLSHTWKFGFHCWHVPLPSQLWDIHQKSSAIKTTLPWFICLSISGNSGT